MNNRLSGRDFITLGIFNAISIVIYMAVAFALCTTVIGGFIASGVAFMVAAISYILMGVKIKKRGVFIISGVLLALVSLSGGNIPHTIMAIAGGIAADFIIGRYGSKLRLCIGYGVFALADFLGTVIPVLMFGTASFTERAEKWKMSAEQIEKALSYFSIQWIVVFGIITFALGALGAFISTKLLKKHFMKAGIV